MSPVSTILFVTKVNKLHTLNTDYKELQQTSINMPSVISHDLRSEAQDAKRAREHSQKWANGTRPLSGVCTITCRSSLDSYRHDNFHDGRVRPDKADRQYPFKTQNVNKTLRVMSQIDMPQDRYRANLDARVQIADPDSLTDYLAVEPAGFPEARSPADGVLYSFDSQVTPGPLSLDVFIKENPRATRAAERHLENEYEIVDGNGDSVKGRRARNMLRGQKNAPLEEHSELARDDDGFELI